MASDTTGQAAEISLGTPQMHSAAVSQNMVTGMGNELAMSGRMDAMRVGMRERERLSAALSETPSVLGTD